MSVIKQPTKNNNNSSQHKPLAAHLMKIPNTPQVANLNTVLAHLDSIKAKANSIGEEQSVQELIGKTTMTSILTSEEKDIDGHQRTTHFLKVELAATGSKSIFSITNINDFKRNNKFLCRIISYLLCKTVAVAMANRQLCTNYLFVSLQELVDLGMYSNKDSAAKGMSKARDLIPQIKVSGTLKISPKKNIAIDVDEPFFTSVSKPQKGIITVGINPNINWKDITAFFSIVPKYMFSLSVNALILCHYICYLARQANHLNDIKRNNSFTIKLRHIQQILDLKHETSTEHPTQLILNPIREAVKEIQNADEQLGKALGNTTRCLDLKLVESSNWTPTECLDKGYLEVTLLGNMKDYFLDTAEQNKKKKDKAIEAAERRKKAKAAKETANANTDTPAEDTEE